MVDAFAEAGGLACTDITPEGFLFDMVSSYYYTQLNSFFLEVRSDGCLMYIGRACYLLSLRLLRSTY
jgi:hypothetical protein